MNYLNIISVHCKSRVRETGRLSMSMAVIPWPLLRLQKFIPAEAELCNILKAVCGFFVIRIESGRE